MFGKIVAISTVKHLSRNYASFSNQVCMSGIAYPLLIGLKASWNHYPSTADFHGDGCFLQNAGFTKGLRIASVVCDVNSSTEGIQVNSALKKKTFYTIHQVPYTFSDCNLPAERFQRLFMHTIFPANGFVIPTPIVNTVTPVTAHSRNK